MSSVKVNLKEIDNLISEFASNHNVKVGILSQDASKGNGESTNLEIGIVHEFGSLSRNIPRRSFLKDPVVEKSQDISNVAIKELKGKFKEKNFVFKSLRRIGMYVESVVQDAFESGFDGRWQKLSQITIDKKKSERQLIDKGYLRQAISSRVDKVK